MTSLVALTRRPEMPCSRDGLTLRQYRRSLRARRRCIAAPSKPTVVGLMLVMTSTACHSSPPQSRRGEQHLSEVVADTTTVFLDSTPYSVRVFWPNASVIDESPEPLPYRPKMPPSFAVAPGDHTVLMIKDGWSRGRRSTAHASHDTLYLLLPASLSPGQILHPSPHTGTLCFDSFSGYGFRYLDESRPIDADIEILSVSDSWIRARVTVSLTIYFEPSRAHDRETKHPRTWPRGQFAFHGTETFERAPDR